MRMIGRGMRAMLMVGALYAVAVTAIGLAADAPSAAGAADASLHGAHDKQRHSHDYGRHQGRRRRSPAAHASIVGGRTAGTGTLGSLAFVVDERGEEVGLCTGTIVAPNLVLTAGHCAVDMETGVIREPSGFGVVTGNVDWASEERQVLGVSRVIVYPGFRLSGALRWWGDAALLELSGTTSAPSIAIASGGEARLWEAGKPAIIAGWGESVYGEQPTTTLLQWAPTVVQSSTWCERAAPGFHPVGQLCTIDPPSYLTGTCEGDSGGPLLVEDSSEKPVEIGITQSGYECSTRAPSVFTKTSLIAAWVKRWEAELPPPEEASEEAPLPPVAVRPEKPTRTSIAGAYLGATTRPDRPFSFVVGRSEKQVTALAGSLMFRCGDGRRLRWPLTGLSNADYLRLEGNKFGALFTAGTERVTVNGTIDRKTGEANGRLHGRYTTGGGERCYTGNVRWSAQRSPAGTNAGPLAAPGRYSGESNQGLRTELEVGEAGDVLSGLRFTALYHCRHHRAIRRTEQFLSRADTETIEDAGTFTVLLAGRGYKGRFDGAIGLVPGKAFGTLEASIRTGGGTCRTGLVPWQARARG